MDAPGPGRNPGRAGWVFGAVTVAPAMLAAAWLLPALPLLLADRFSARPMVFMFAPLAAGLCYFAVRELPTAWPSFRGQDSRGKSRDPSQSQNQDAGRDQGQGISRDQSQRTSQDASRYPSQDASRTPWWALAATVAVAAGFAAWQIAERTEQIIYLRDPSTYLAVGYWIAHHSSLPIPDWLAAFGGPHPGLGLASSNYYPRGTGIVPQFMTGAPLALAAAIWLGGIPAALVITPLIGGCVVLAFGGLVARLAGPRWAPVAAAVLALSLPEQYTSRGSFSEPLAQVLLFGGLCLLADSLTVKNTDWPNQDKVLAGLAGLALGLTVLVRIDGLSDILPAVPFLGVLLVARRRQAIPFGVGLLIGVGYGLADGYLKSRPYLDLEASSLHPLALILAVILVATAIGTVLTRSRMARNAAKRLLENRPARWLPAAAAILTVGILIGFAVRPLLQTVAGDTDPASIAYVAELQKLAHLPVNGRRQYYEDSLYWVIWYLGVPAVLLGAFGLAVLAKRCAQALLRWTDPTGAARIWALPLMMSLWSVLTVLWRPAIAPDQPWASRRLVPFVLPGLILCAIWATTWLKDQVGRPRSIQDGVVFCCVASLVIPAALTTLDVGVTKQGTLTAQGMAFRKIGAGELTAVTKLCQDLGPDASVVILDSLTADGFAQVVRGICDAPAAVLQNPAKVDAVVQGIERVGRRPVLLAGSQAELTGTGAGPPPKEVVNLLTTQEAHNLTAPPTGTWPIRYTVWMSTP